MLTFFLFSCTWSPTAEQGVSSEPVVSYEGTGRVHGTVAASGGRGGLEVMVGDQPVRVDALGQFWAPEVPASPELVVRAQRRSSSGPPTVASTRLDLPAGATRSVTLRVPEPALVGRFAADQGTELDVGYGSPLQVQIPPDAVRHADGTPVVGEVEVYAHVVDQPHQVMFPPGDLQTVDGSLESFGMFSMTLAQGDEVLELARPIDVALVHAPGGEAGQLYWFDEAAGIWKAEGEVEVEGGVARASLPHLSWWNLDRPFEGETAIRGRLVDEAGEPVAGAAVSVQPLDYMGWGKRFTRSDGTFCVDVKRNGDHQLYAVWSDGATVSTWRGQVTSDAGPASCATGGGVDLGSQQLTALELGCVRVVLDNPDHCWSLGVAVYEDPQSDAPAGCYTVPLRHEAEEEICLPADVGGRVELYGGDLLGRGGHGAGTVTCRPWGPFAQTFPGMALRSEPLPWKADGVAAVSTAPGRCGASCPTVRDIRLTCRSMSYEGEILQTIHPPGDTHRHTVERPWRGAP